MSFLLSFAFWIRTGFFVLALAFIDYSAAGAGLTNIFYLGDSLLDDGNFKALTHAQGADYFSNSAPWGTVVNVALGLPTAGRWTAAGSHAPLGNNYAVSGSGTNYSSTPTNTSLHGQAARLLADYPNGLPANSLVVVAIGSNDVIGVVGFGGVWSTDPAEWKVGNAGFTVPAAGSSVTVTVNSTTGMKTGATNLVAFPVNNALPIMMAVTQVDPAQNTVTLTNKVGSPGAKIAPNSNFEVCGKWFVDQVMPILRGDIKAILADHGRVVLVLLPPTDLFPVFKTNQVIAHETWRYFYSKMKALVSADMEGVLTFDLRPVYQDVFDDPTHHGFKFNYPCWMGSGAPDPNDYMFWDLAHPTGSMHRYIAQRFLEFLRAKGLTK